MRIAQAQVAVIFDLDTDIVLTLGASLKKVQEHYHGNVQVLNNIPGFAPPNAPRLALSCPNFVLNVALMRIDIMITPPQHICTDENKVFDYITSLISSLNTLLIEKNLQYEWTGCVLSIEFPQNEFPQKENAISGSLECFSPIFDKLINIKRNNKKMASFSFHYGFIEDPFFINYGITGYDKLNLSFPNIFQPSQELFPPVTQEIVESGIAVTLDVNNNNKPQKAKMIFKEDFAAVFTKTISLYKTLLDDTNLKGLI